MNLLYLREKKSICTYWRPLIETHLSKVPPSKNCHTSKVLKTEVELFFFPVEWSRSQSQLVCSRRHDILAGLSWMDFRADPDDLTLSPSLYGGRWAPGQDAGAPPPPLSDLDSLLRCFSCSRSRRRRARPAEKKHSSHTSRVTPEWIIIINNRAPEHQCTCTSALSGILSCASGSWKLLGGG